MTDTADNMLARSDTSIHVSGGLETLPAPLDLTAISRAMHGKSASDDGMADGASMTHTAGRNYVISDRKFGSFWDFASAGITLANVYHTSDKIDSGTMVDGFTSVDATLHPMGPAIRFLRGMPGAKPKERHTDSGDLTPHYKACIQNALAQSAFIARQIKRGGYLNPPIELFNSDDWYVFRLGTTTNEPDDKKLVGKILAFHQFVIEAEAHALSERIDRRKVLGIEKMWKYPATVSDIHIPPMTRQDGSVYTLPEYAKDYTDKDGEPMDEYVPDIARDKMQNHMVIASLTTPTLLNCVDDSKYLKEGNALSPLGRDEYDEAILIRPTRPFATPAKAQEFKDNFAKHVMPEAAFHIISMNERVPILPLFTEWARKLIPHTYHKQVSQAAMVELPEAAAVKRELAEAQGIEIVHLGPDQTREEAEAEMDKIRRRSRAQERIAKTNEMVAKLNVLRAKKDQAENASMEMASIPEEGGGGGSK